MARIQFPAYSRQMTEEFEVGSRNVTARKLKTDLGFVEKRR